MQLGDKPKYSWQDAVKRYLRETLQKKSHKDDRQRLLFAHSVLGGMMLHEIDRDAIDRLIEAKLATGASPATVNRVTAIVRAVMLKAQRQWGWIETVPHFRMLKEPRGRTRWLTREQAEKLASCLPAWLEPVYRAGFLTGLRQSNLLNLEWRSVDLERAVLVSTSVWKKAVGGGGPRVSLCWHSATRHSWASWLTMAGCGEAQLKALGAWRSGAHRRYQHLSPEALRESANLISRPIVSAA